MYESEKVFLFGTDSCLWWLGFVAFMSESCLTWMDLVFYERDIVQIWKGGSIRHRLWSFMNESCRNYERVMPLMWMGHVFYEWVMSHTWVSHVSCEWVVSFMKETYYESQGVSIRNRLWSFMNESCRTHDWVMSHLNGSCLWWKSHSDPKRCVYSCAPRCVVYTWVMLHAWVNRVSYKNTTSPLLNERSPAPLLEKKSPTKEPYMRRALQKSPTWKEPWVNRVSYKGIMSFLLDAKSRTYDMKRALHMRWKESYKTALHTRWKALYVLWKKIVDEMKRALFMSSNTHVQGGEDP